MWRLHTRPTARGFTLIELLVVIAIIGMLASIILASLNNARIKARDAARRETLKQMQSALELYANDHNGAYPLGGWINSEQGSNWFPALVPTYIAQAPHDIDVGTCPPDVNVAKAYAFLGQDGTGYKLIVCAESTVPATDGMYDPVRPGYVLALCMGSASFVCNTK